VRPPAENFENEAGAIEHLGVPRLLQIALLHRGERAIHHHQARFVGFHQPGDFLDLAFAEISRRPHRGEHDDAGLLDLEIDGARKPDRLVEPRRRRAFRSRHTRRRTSQHRFNDQRAAGRRATAGRVLGAQPVSARVATARLQSDLFPGRCFLSAFEELDGMTGHDGRNGVLVDELRMPVATQQHAEIIEPGHDALQLHTIHEKDRQRSLVLANMIEKSVLK
jgi:hypothetical protein